MSSPSFRARKALLAALLASAMACAFAQASDGAPQVENSDLDAQLFYQLLIGEIELRDGEAGAAYQIMLDAARRTREEQLYRRATEIALQARAGDQALAAVMAWRSALPGSIEAHRYLIQLLVALNRADETVEPLRSLIELTPEADRAGLIRSLPGFFSRSGDKTQTPALVERVTQGWIEQPATRAAARVALARAWLGVPDISKALPLLQQAHADAPTDESVALLATSLVATVSQAEAIVTAFLAARPDDHAVRLNYVRVLTGAQRYGDAAAQLAIVTERAPDMAPPWLTLGALQVELKHPAEATAALKTYLQKLDTVPAAAPAGSAADDEDGDEPASLDAGARDQGRNQAWLLLAQAAEQQHDFKAAEAWLAKIDDPQRLLEVQVRRATLLARQGRIKEAVELVRRVPEKQPGDVRAKLVAEAQVLRDVKLWRDAYAVLEQANREFPDDADLLYEQSMLAEKLNRMDEMERLLRRVIALKPEYHHAYNALGYSLAERNLRLDEARDLIRKALELSPGEPFITDSLGWVEYRMGHRDEALRLLRQAYRARPDVEIAAHLGEVLWMAGERDEARRVWREARTRDGGNEVLRETLARLRVDL